MRPMGHRNSLTDEVVGVVRSAIRSGELAPGSLYSVNQLAERFGISRTPVREGLLRLEEAGMVSFERNRGFRVLDRTSHDIAEVFQLRLLLEVPATAAAAARTDRTAVDLLRHDIEAMLARAESRDLVSFWEHDCSFHDRILRLGGNQRLAKIVAGLRDTTITLGISTVDGARSLEDVAAEHLPILTALERGDGVKAALAMRIHLLRTAEILVGRSHTTNGRTPGATDDQAIVERAADWVSPAHIQNVHGTTRA